MKKIIFTFIFAMFFIAAFSQITLTYATHGLKNGDMVNYLTGDLLSDTTGFTPGPGGAGHTWNFMNLNIPAISVTDIYQSVASTPYGINFPTATTADFDSMSFILDSSFIYNYYKVDSTGINEVGTTDSDFIMNYTKSELLMKFPFTYNSDTKDSFSATGKDTTDGLQLVRQGFMHVYSDGYGTLELKGKTFNNVLRVRSLETYTDYLIDSEFGDTLEIENYSTQTYQWYTGSLKSPVMQYILGTYTDNLDSGFVDSTSTIMINKTALLSIKNEIVLQSLVIYPNPCTDELNVILPVQLTGEFQILIIDINGNILKRRNISSGNVMNNLIIDIHDLSSGIYAVRVISGDKSYTQKIIKK